MQSAARRGWRPVAQSMLKDRLSVAIALLLLLTAGYFVFWGLEYTNHQHTLLFLMAAAFGLFMAFNIGGNDVANSFGTSVGAGTLSIKQALAVAAVFEVSGAVIAGGAVTDTIRKGIVDLSAVTGDPAFSLMDFVYIMMSALLAAALWLLIATRRGWPVSTTHSIIGGIVGSSITLGFLAGGADEAFSLVKWDKIAMIALSWIVSPVLGGLCSYVLFWNIRKFILQYNEQAKAQLKHIKRLKKAHKQEHKTALERMTELELSTYNDAMIRDAARIGELEASGEAPGHEHSFESEYFRRLQDIERQRKEIKSHRALRFYVPILAAAGSMVITAMLLFKGLKNIPLNLSQVQNWLIILMVAAAVWMAIYVFARALKSKSLDRSTFMLFSWMQVFTAAGFAFSHGSNDIANAIGPFAAILDVLRTGGINPKAPVPPIALLSFGIALVAGLWFIGKEVIQTVGRNLTRMHPSSGFAAELSAAGVVMLASTLGIPVSSTHILVGAVLGIGMVNRAANWELMKPIGAAWLITLPAAATLSSIAFFALRAIF